MTRLLHHHFQNDKTKVAKDANAVVAKYVDVFVREAIARAAFERAEADSASGGRNANDGFLEVCCYSFPLRPGRGDANSVMLQVEDLEKMAPQLTMDF